MTNVESLKDEKMFVRILNSMLDFKIFGAMGLNWVYAYHTI